MKIFTLEWSCYEEYNYYQFYHLAKSNEDFDQDVNSLMVKYGQEYIEQETCWVGINSWVEYVSTKLTELGYNRVETHNYGFFGGSILEGDREEKKWESVVGKELLQMAISKNKNLRTDLYKDF